MLAGTWHISSVSTDIGILASKIEKKLNILKFHFFYKIKKKNVI